MENKKAQVWIESVIYTLVGLAVIGLLLLVTRPQISKTQDEFIIQQTMKAFHELDNKMIEIKQATGNRRIVEFQLSKGELLLDGNADKIKWTLRASGYMYSEPGYETSIGNIKILTTQNVDKYDVQLTLDYSSNIDMSIERQGIAKILQPAKNPYKLIIENLGPNAEGMIQVDVALT
jgi:type II secretory pathway pseudopilin PulG